MPTAMEVTNCSGALDRVRVCSSPSMLEADLAAKRRIEGGDPGCCSSSSTSSIGRNSDNENSAEEEKEEEEVQSSLKSPLDMIGSLEEVLPIRRGISKFYNGRSKSFTNLAVATSTSSIRELGKPETAYTQRRSRSMHVLALKRVSRPASKNSLAALAMAMGSGKAFSPASSPRLLPPPHPKAAKACSGNLKSQSPSAKPGAFSCSWRPYPATEA